MKVIIRYGSLFIGCLLVALSINLLLIPHELISFGTCGLALLLKYLYNANVAINLFLLNAIIISLSYFVINKDLVKSFILPSILIPILVYITSPLIQVFDIYLPEVLLLLIASGVLSGVGYNLIYKNGYQAGVSFLFDEIFGKIFKFHSKVYSWIIDIILVIALYFIFGYESAVYSLVIIIITKFMVTKVRFGINDSKMFHIITSKEKEVKNYILNDLKYELTELDVKGGFTKKNNKILLSVISKEDYYKLKEGVKLIDPKAFIAITDTYDVVNRKSF